MEGGVNTENILESAQATSGGMVHIIYGTHTGNTMMLADEVAERVEELGFDTKVEDMEDFDVAELPNIEMLLILVSTDGEGDPPLMSEDLLEYLQSDKAPDLSHLSYSVLALGDTTYTFFCKAGKDFDKTLGNLGATKLADRIDCDVDYEDGYAIWISKVLRMLESPK